MDFFQTANGFLSYAFISHICHIVSTHKVETATAQIKRERSKNVSMACSVYSVCE